jgi:prefoldin subunit 5
MPKLFDWLRSQQQHREQVRELRALREEVEKLRAQNERMRAGMRRCVTCEYRLEVVGRR